MTKRTLLAVARLFFGLLTLVAIGVQLVISIGLHFSVVSYFSYFTNLSNILIGTVFLIGAYALLTHREPTVRDDLVRGQAVVGMAVVGLVFGALLRNVELGGLQPWVNTIVHYIMPVAAVADWLILPPKSRLRIQQAALWLIFPFVYLIYTLIRGAAIGFYPYPFLNPAKVGGYGGVALYSVGITVAFVVIGLILLYLGNRLPRRLEA